MLFENETIDLNNSPLEDLVQKKTLLVDKIYELENRQKNLKYQKEQIEKLLEEKCLHSYITENRYWDGHKNESYYDCDTCGTNLLYHQTLNGCIKTKYQ